MAREVFFAQKLGPQQAGRDGAARRDEGAPARPAGRIGRPSLSSEKQLRQSCGGNGFKTAEKLEVNVLSFVEKFGVDKVGFFTLTVGDQKGKQFVKVWDAKEAGRRFNNLARRALKRYRAWIAVLERHQDGSIHFHLLVALGEDIRTGVSFREFEEGVYTSAGDQLRSEWAFWRRTARRYGFGRHELLPIKTREEAIARYIGKYIGKHMEHRLELDKGVRLVRYSRYVVLPGSREVGYRRAYGNFMGVGGLSWLWRQKVRIFAGKLDKESRGYNEVAMQNRFGKHWAYKMRAEIMAVNLHFAKVQYPDLYTMALDGIAFHGQSSADWLADAVSPEHVRDIERAEWVSRNLLGHAPKEKLAVAVFPHNEHVPF